MDLPVATVVDSWMGFVMYRIALLEREPERHELADPVGLLPFTKSATPADRPVHDGSPIGA